MERHNESHIGSIGWGLIGLGVLAWDFTMDESLTHAFERARTHPVGRYIALGGLAVTAAHLLDQIPHQYDPFYAILNLKNEQAVE